jgi:hypothetical protein
VNPLRLLISLSVACAAMLGPGPSALADSPHASGPGAAAPRTGTPLPALAQAALREYPMPDGTGTVGLAEGWHTHNQSLMGGLFLEGPADQHVIIARSFSVFLPGSPMAQMQQRARTPVLLAPFSTPLDAFRILAPQMSAMSQRRGGPAFEFDNLTDRLPARSYSPNGRSEFIEYGITEAGPGGRRHYHVLAEIGMAPLPGGQSWMYTVTAMRAPDATFEHDLPVMMEMVTSKKENGEVIMAKARENVRASQARNAAVIDQVHQRSRAFDAQRAATARASNASARSADDFDEYIRGTRTVEDTRTGERGTVDLGDADRITDKLNEGDADRYRQIPLRDEADPIQ